VFSSCRNLGAAGSGKRVRLFLAMAQRSLVILRYKDNVPMVASCRVCRRRFFTVVTIMENPQMAER
jgi:hypothetical protein